MIVRIDKSLEKDLKRIKDLSIKKELAEVIREMQNTQKSIEIGQIKKLKGAGNFFRIRIGDYRLGFIIEGNEIHLIRLLHRKEIYRYFP